MRKRESSYTVGGNVGWYSHYGEQYGSSLKNEKIELPYYPAIVLLGTFLEKNIVKKRYIHPSVHCRTINNSQDWKQSKCPSPEKRIQKMWYVYTVGYHSAIKGIKHCHLQRQS